MKQEMTGWQWHQLDHMQIICTSFQTDNQVSTSSPDFLQAGACSSWCPTNSVTVSMQWRQLKALKVLLITVQSNITDFFLSCGGQKDKFSVIRIATDPQFKCKTYCSARCFFPAVAAIFSDVFLASWNLGHLGKSQILTHVCSSTVIQDSSGVFWGPCARPPL